MMHTYAVNKNLDVLCTVLSLSISFHWIQMTKYYFQLEVKYAVKGVKMLNGNVSLSSCMTTATASLYSQRDDGVTRFHHTSVSSSKVCHLLISFC